MNRGNLRLVTGGIPPLFKDMFPFLFYINNFRAENILRDHLNPTSHFSDEEKNA